MATRGSPHRDSGFRRVSRASFVTALWLFTGCILVQAYLAGQAAMIDPGVWSDHVAFVKAFAPLTVLLFVLAWLGRRSSTEKWWALATVALIAPQFFSAEARAWSTCRWCPGLHAIGAMGLFLSCAILCWLTWPRRRG